MFPTKMAMHERQIHNVFHCEMIESVKTLVIIVKSGKPTG